MRAGAASIQNTIGFVTTERYTDAAEAGLAAVACEPLRESAHRALVRVHIAQGNRSEALRQYDLCRRLLHDRVGLAPSPAIEAAIAPLRA